MGLLPYSRTCFSLYFFFSFIISISYLIKTCAFELCAREKAEKVTSSWNCQRWTFQLTATSQGRLWIGLLLLACCLLLPLSLRSFHSARCAHWSDGQRKPWWPNTGPSLPTITEVELSLWVNNNIRLKLKTRFQCALQKIGRRWDYPFMRKRGCQSKVRWTTKSLLPAMDASLNWGKHKLVIMLTTLVVKSFSVLKFSFFFSSPSPVHESQEACVRQCSAWA